jgi:hypothetical protein
VSILIIPISKIFLSLGLSEHGCVVNHILISDSRYVAMSNCVLRVDVDSPHVDKILVAFHFVDFL